MRRTRIGLFGGTFDPPHLGHLILASQALHQLRLSRILWLLTPDPPNKQGAQISPVRQRLAMLRLAVKGEAAFEVSTIELERPGPHYTIETIERLSKTHANTATVLLLGGDELRDLPNWRRARDVLRSCVQIGAMERGISPPDLARLERRLPGLGRKLRVLDVPVVDIASSDIRRRVAARLPHRFLVTPAVFDYIRRHRLYQ